MRPSLACRWVKGAQPSHLALTPAPHAAPDSEPAQPCGDEAPGEPTCPTTSALGLVPSRLLSCPVTLLPPLPGQAHQSPSEAPTLPAASSLPARPWVLWSLRNQSALEGAPAQVRGGRVGTSPGSH